MYNICIFSVRILKVKGYRKGCFNRYTINCVVRCVPSALYLLCVTNTCETACCRGWQQMSKDWSSLISRAEEFQNPKFLRFCILYLQIKVSPHSSQIQIQIHIQDPIQPEASKRRRVIRLIRHQSEGNPGCQGQISILLTISHQMEIGPTAITCQMELGGKPQVTYASLTLRGEGWLVAMHQMQIIMKACNEPKSRGGAIVHQLLLSRLSLHLSSLLRLTPLPNLICFDSCFANLLLFSILLFLFFINYHFAWFPFLSYIYNIYESCKMSYILHRANFSIQMFPYKRCVNCDKFNTLIEWNWDRWPIQGKRVLHMAGLKIKPH